MISLPRPLELHPLVVIFSMVSVVNNFAIYLSVVLYYTVVVMDICNHMNLPLLTPVINVPRCFH